MICCCGKYHIEDDDEYLRVNDTIHKPLTDGLLNFCGHVDKHKIFALEQEVAQWSHKCAAKDAEIERLEKYCEDRIAAGQSMISKCCEELIGKSRRIAELEAENERLKEVNVSCDECRVREINLSAELEQENSELKEQLTLEDIELADNNRNLKDRIGELNTINAELKAVVQELAESLAKHLRTEENLCIGADNIIEQATKRAKEESDDK